MSFKKARRVDAKLRMALTGPSGAGKTYTALKIARTLIKEGDEIALIDSERGSALKYAADAAGKGGIADFSHLELDSFSPDTYMAAIAEARKAGFAVLIVDSLSHAWDGKDGVLEQVDKRAKHNGGNSFGGWKDVTPMHRRLVDALLSYPGHVIVTMRTKQEYALEANEKGKIQVRKLGLKPVQRDDMEYEFDVVGSMSIENEMTVTKTRCSALRGGVFPDPGDNVAIPLRDWLTGSPEAAAIEIKDLRQRFLDLYGDAETAAERESTISKWASGNQYDRLEDLDGAALVRVTRGLDAHEAKQASQQAEVD